MSLRDAPDSPANEGSSGGSYDDPFGAPHPSPYGSQYGPHYGSLYGPPYGRHYAEPPRRSRGGPLAAVLAGLLIAAGSIGVAVGVDRLMDRGSRDGYEFMAHQPGDPNDPVTYNPCKTIRVVVNPDGAPGNWRELVETAIDHVSAPSGLRLSFVEETDERPSLRRPNEDERYGAGATPVLVAWATPEQVPDLAGNTAGLGGSQADWEEGRIYWVTGGITLDSIDFAMMDQPSQQAVVDHEFAHVLGLNHVDDPTQLMHAENYGRERFADGDLAGLKAVGDAPCPN